MVNLSKKWGAVIGCWCVALVLIVTGICLGLTVPSSAADETVLTVTCGNKIMPYTAADFVKDNDESSIYFDDLLQQFGDAITEHTVTIKLLADIKVTAVYYDGNTLPADTKIVLDLNGHKLESLMANFHPCSTSFTLADSNPDVTRYFRDVTKEDTHGYAYEFYDIEPIGIGLGSSYDEIKGGIMSCGYFTYGITLAEGGELVIDGGNLLGQGLISALEGKSQLILNGGKFLVYAYGDYYVGMNVNFEKPTCLLTVGDEQCLTINGGSFYGTVAQPTVSQDGNFDHFDYVDDLVNSPLVKLGNGIALDSKDVNGIKVYTAVDANNEPVTTPTEPITDQPANNNNNMIGIIVLGAATVVMIAGVSAAISIAVKRRKGKKA